MKHLPIALTFLLSLIGFAMDAQGQSRRPIDNEHPLWMIHIDVWNAADPQKIIDLVPDDIRPYVCMNLSPSCQYDKNEWRKATFTATLKAGVNTLLLVNNGGISMHIDQVVYTPSDVEPERYAITVRKANYGSLVPRCQEAAEGDTVLIDIQASNGYCLKELQVLNGVNFTMGTTLSLETLADGNTVLAFVMPDDIVTLKPVFAKGVNVADGIVTLRNSDGTQSSVIYDLGGQRVNTPPRKGIYIKNGKRYLSNRKQL